MRKHTNNVQGIANVRNRLLKCSDEYDMIDVLISKFILHVWAEFIIGGHDINKYYNSCGVGPLHNKVQKIHKDLNHVVSVMEGLKKRPDG